MRPHQHASIAFLFTMILFIGFLLVAGFHISARVPYRCPRGDATYELISYRLAKNGDEYDCHYVKHVHW